jgi:hypothetical protein
MNWLIEIPIPVRPLGEAPSIRLVVSWMLSSQVSVNCTFEFRGQWASQSRLCPLLIFTIHIYQTANGPLFSAVILPGHLQSPLNAWVFASCVACRGTLDAFSIPLTFRLRLDVKSILKHQFFDFDFPTSLVAQNRTPRWAFSPKVPLGRGRVPMSQWCLLSFSHVNGFVGICWRMVSVGSPFRPGYHLITRLQAEAIPSDICNRL